MPDFVNSDHTFPLGAFVPTVGMPQIFSHEADVSPDPYDQWSTKRFCDELLNRGISEEEVSEHGESMFWKVLCFPAYIKTYLVLVDCRPGGDSWSLFDALDCIKLRSNQNIK